MKIFKESLKKIKMCIICEGNYDPETLTRLECNCCKNLTSIPDTLIQISLLSQTHLLTLQHLHCITCPNLTSIPEICVYLDCRSCPWLDSPHNPEYEENLKKFKENYESLLSVYSYIVRDIAKYLVPIVILKTKVAI